MDNMKRWYGPAFALLTIAFPAIWFLSAGATDWLARTMFWLLVLGALIGVQPIHRDRVVQLCAVLALLVVAGYVWQRFTVPEALLGGSSARKYIPAFCFFVVVAYGAAVMPRVSPFLLLLSAGIGLLVHLLWFVPAGDWAASWRLKRVTFGFHNWEHAAILFSSALLAAVIFLPRAVSSSPPRARGPVLVLSVAFILMAMYFVVTLQTRATWLGLLLSGFVALLFGVGSLFVRRRSIDRRTVVRWVVAGAGVVLVGSAALYFWAGDIVAKRLAAEAVSIETIKETARLETVPRSSIKVRIGTWAAALDWIAERPVFGWGGRAASRLIELSPYFDERFKNQFGHLHNSYLETLLNVGGAVMACMITIVLLVAWRTVAAWRQGWIPTDVFLFACAFYPFWATVNLFESYIMYDSGFLLNALVGGFVYSWYLRSQHATDARRGALNEQVRRA
ncbi:O-antigen ligase family protein [Pseudothauera rhizosphaerae]|nr:O-antigen ligase family protein [Pseudothauera rhizosphaerae]